MEINDNSAKYIVINGSMYEAGPSITSLSESHNFCEAEDSSVIYEVIRFINGKPVYFDDHYERLLRSAEMLGHTEIIKKQALLEYSGMLLKINGLENCNIKVLCLLQKNGKEDAPFVIYSSKAFYPPESAYSEGVSVDCFSIERNMPNAKVRREEYLAAIDRFKNTAGRPLFEVLLINQKDEFTEGSKSNLFFVKNRTVITSPDDVVLKGVMRKHVIELCDILDIPVVYRNVPKAEAAEMDAAFLTGTSIKALPVGNIGTVSLPSAENSIVKKIMVALSEDMIKI